jgi:hypothetical protein
VRSQAKAPSAGSIWTAGAAALLSAVVFLAIASAPAFAAAGHSVVRTFSTGPHTGPSGIAIDAAGNVYVAEQEAGRVEKFDATGSPVPFTASARYIEGNRLLGTPAGPSNPRGVAVDRSGGPDDGNIYVNVGDSGGETYVYDASGEFLGPLGHEPDDYCGVAVNPSNGAVYVSEPGDFATGTSVRRFAAPSGDPSTALPNGKLISSSGGGCPIAVDSSGALYLAFGNTMKYDPSEFESPSPTGTLVESAFGVTLGVDPATGDLYSDYGGSIGKRNAAGTQQGSQFGQLSNSLAVAADGSGRVMAPDYGGGVFVFGTTEVQLPTGTTGSASSVTVDSASVEGTVDPDGAGSITGCEFRYGEDSGYSEGAVPCAPATPMAAPIVVSASIAGLTSGVTYHYRLFVTNANGTQASTGDQTFTTPAATENVSTQPASEVKKDSAVLNGAYAGDGLDVHYFFEWGRTNAYGHTTPVPPGGDAGTGTGPQNVAPIQISGLEGNTVYHYRLVVSTAKGITRGQDESLVTSPAVTNLSADPATGITDTSAELHGSFDVDSNPTSYFFEWGPTTNYGNTAPVPPGPTEPAGSGRIDLPAVPISGLDEGLTYHYRVVATNAVGQSVSADASFSAAEEPQVNNVNSRNLQATSVDLVGEINPRHGHTTFRFEWGPTATYGHSSPVPDGDAGSGNTAVPVSTRLEGLASGVTYHFRLVASNQYGSAASPDQTFGFYPPNCPNAQLRQETRSNTLPDCRAYELVTPGFAQGSIIYPLAGPPAPLATSPAKIAYTTAFTPFAEEAGDPSNYMADMYVSTRSDTGWYQRFVGRSANETVQMGGPPKGHVENIFQGIRGPGTMMIGSQASPSLDRLIDYDRGWPDSQTEVNHGHASNSPYVWDTSTGKLVARWPTNVFDITHGEDFVGIPEASPDFSHFVFQSNIPFADGVAEVTRSITCCQGGGGWPENTPPAAIYDNDLSTGSVELVSLKSDGTPFEGYVFDISDDASRILMSREITNASGNYFPAGVQQFRDVQGLYLRVDEERTLEIAPGRQVTYVGSTADGATIYLRSAEQLTADDHDHSTDLFVWHESDQQITRISVGDSGQAGDTDDCGGITWNGGTCNIQLIDFLPYTALIDLGNHFTAGQGGNGTSDNMIASKSGDIYFISPEQLLAGRGEEGRANLYVYRNGGLKFVVSLNPQQVCTTLPVWSSCAAGAIARMQVSPNGSHMAFVAQSNVTGYDTAGHTEMYTYSPDSGRIICASCRPDGQPPTSEVLASQNGLFQTYDGRVFFSTVDALVPRDTDGVEDVYEYNEGRAQLISAGTGFSLTGFGGVIPSATSTGLVNVSADGTNVYFATLDTLVTQDHNGGSLKIYDARTGGGFPAERTPPNCTAADECHGPGASQGALPPDRTSANLGKPAKTNAHKAKKHKKKAHKKKHRKQKKSKAHRGSRKQGRTNHG